MGYIAAKLGPKGIRARAISPGPIPTRATSGIESFDPLLTAAASQASLHHLVEIEGVGYLTAFLGWDATRCITGTVIPMDDGEHLTA